MFKQSFSYTLSNMYITISSFTICKESTFEQTLPLKIQLVQFSDRVAIFLENGLFILENSYLRKHRNILHGKSANLKNDEVKMKDCRPCTPTYPFIFFSC